MVKKSVKISLWVIAGLVGLFIAASFFAGSYMVDYALRAKVFDSEKEHEKLNDRYPYLRDWLDTLIARQVMKDTVITDDEGFRISAFYAEAEQNVGRTAIIVHGYTSNPMGMMHIARMFRDSLGYNVLLPALNYHSGSEGDAIQMGWKDRLDVEQWIPIAHEIFKDSLMVVHGISMGGATTMMVSGDEVPEYVKGFIDDCGYSSVWEQFRKELKGQFGLPPFPILYCANILTKSRYGWDFKTASSTDQLAKCEKPVLFIHGDKDDYVLTENVYRNYDAKVNGYREIWIAEGSEHGVAYKDHPAEYTAVVRNFLKNQVER